MTFKAYIDNIYAKTGKTPDDFRKLAEKKGLLKPGVKAMEVVNWLKKEHGLGHGHAMAIYATFKGRTSDAGNARRRRFGISFTKFCAANLRFARHLAATNRSTFLNTTTPPPSCLHSQRPVRMIDGQKGETENEHDKSNHPIGRTAFSGHGARAGA